MAVVASEKRVLAKEEASTAPVHEASDRLLRSCPAIGPAESYLN